MMTEATPVMTPIPPMPPKIVKAVAAVMKQVPKLNKGERNTHGNYNFASVDDFLEAVRPLMAEQELVISSDEDDFEVIGEGDKAWLRMRFAFAAHCGGETYGPMRRSIMINAKMGSQAFGAAQSYAEKQFLRSLFKIATGEGANIDADSLPQEGLARTRSPRRNGQDREQQSQTGLEPEEGWGAWALDLQSRIGKASDEDAINGLRDDPTTKKRINALRTADPSIYGAIGRAFSERRAALAKEPEPA